MIIKKIIIFLLLLFGTTQIFAENKMVPRTIIALYDGNATQVIKRSRIHNFLETPLNHLGLIVEYHDIQKKLPDVINRPDVLGVISWFRNKTEDELKNQEEYAKWAINVIKNGKKFVFFDNPGFGYYSDNHDLYELIEEFFELFGAYSTGINYFNRLGEIIVNKNDLYNFEKKLSDLPTNYPDIKIINKTSYSIVDVKTSDQNITSEAVISPKGGFIAPGFSINSLFVDNKSSYSWYINPFEFLRLAFGLTLYPTPDTTTILGNRIFYSHIDGDGWNNISHVGKSKDLYTLSSEVIYNKVLKPNPDLPVTVGPVAGEIDEDWHGNKKSIEITKKILALPHIEAGTHTYSHPLYWGFFEDYNENKEKPFLDNYTVNMKKDVFGSIKDKFIKYWHNRKKKKVEPELVKSDGDLYVYNGLEDEILAEKPEDILATYDTPRSYADNKYSTEHEILGSKKKIDEYAPENNKVSVVQWSGNTTPYEKALEVAYKNNLLNINGGDSRLDKDFPSYAWISPLSIMVGNYRQIYTSNANEYIYTNKWESARYGFSKLQETLENTEHPFRLRPINLYYHMYSGEFDESLDALLSNVKYIKSQNIIPIKTSSYIKIVLGFFSAKIYQDNPLSWSIENRGELNTIRFDNADDYFIDFRNSNGVLGFDHYQHSLYIFLDPEITKPNFSLTKKNDNSANYVQASSWNIWDLDIKNNHNWKFYTKGYGTGKITWHVSNKDGEYEVFYNNQKFNIKAEDYLLKFSINNLDNQIIRVKITSATNKYSLRVLNKYL